MAPLKSFFLTQQQKNSLNRITPFAPLSIYRYNHAPKEKKIPTKATQDLYARMFGIGKFPSLRLIYKLFLHLGSFLKFFSRGAVFYVSCTKYPCKTPAWLARSSLGQHVAVAPLPLATPVVSPPALALWPCRVDSLVVLAMRFRLFKTPLLLTF